MSAKRGQSEENETVCERKTLRIILGPRHENDSGYRIRHNEELYELLHGHDMVEYIKFKRLPSVSHINNQNRYY